ncbi:pygopus homolog 1 [Trichomycterus rosablanca]|uniref:pygopus homolog 1 n=1 Tax=Trichomycterus rosablanca TaxID=2290929 RepID=UPI002F35B754
MSTDQDKDSFSLKRTRGGDGGLDGLGGPGLLHGSPDKKRRKTNTQAPLIAPLSEYAPPVDPSSDHLVASNPFDDDYDCPPASLKPLLGSNPYFGPSHHPVFRVYGPPQMAPHVQNRMPAPYGSSYQIRNRPPPFAQNPMGPVGMGFTRAPGFNYGHPENLVFINNGMYLPQGQAFRENRAPPAGVNQNHGFSPDGIVGMNRLAVGKPSPNHMSPGLTQPPGNFAQPTTPKRERCEISNKSSPPPRKQNQSAEEGVAQDAELKTKSKLSAEGEKINGALHPNSEPLKKSPRPAEDAKRQSKNASANNGSRNRRSSSAPSEPVYPCGICQGEVNDDQEAILCEASCQKWFHRVCTGMTETAYNLLTAESAAVWGCDACMEEKDGTQLPKTRETPGPATANGGGQT